MAKHTEKGGQGGRDMKRETNEDKRQQQAERGGSGGQDKGGQMGGDKQRDKQQRGGQTDNTRQNR